MQRQIKFRGWNGEKIVDLHKLTSLAVDPKLTDYQDGLYLPLTDKIPLMQYTGLKDKNGVEIYEGDIVHISNEWGECTDHHIAYFGDRDYPAFDLVPSLDAESNGLSHCIGGDYEIEVIGNIYENPELLK